MIIYEYHGTPIERHFILLILRQRSRFLYADMGISTNKKASQLVNYKTYEPINLYEKLTRNTSTELLTLVSLGMEDSY